MVTDLHRVTWIGVVLDLGPVMVEVMVTFQVIHFVLWWKRLTVNGLFPRVIIVVIEVIQRFVGL